MLKNFRWLHRLVSGNRQCTVPLLLTVLMFQLCCFVTNSERFESPLLATEIHLRDLQLHIRYLVTAPLTMLSCKEFRFNNGTHRQVTFKIVVRESAVQRYSTRNTAMGFVSRKLKIILLNAREITHCDALCFIWHFLEICINVLHILW